MSSSLTVGSDGKLIYQLNPNLICCKLSKLDTSDYPSNGFGTSASFKVSSCGTCSVNFYVVGTTKCPDGIYHADVSTNISIVQISHECVATIPTNRIRTTIGVAEDVNLSVCGAPGTVTWSVSGGGTLDNTNSLTPTLTASHNAAANVVTVHFDGGTCDKPFSVVEPNGYYASNVTAIVGYGVNNAGAGMWIPLWLTPRSVSFYKVQISEVGRVSTNATGYFTNTSVWPTNYLDHGANGAGSWVQIHMDNYIGRDKANSGTCPQLPSGGWSAGHFSWPIPAVWQVVGDTTTNFFPWSDQDFTIDTSGNVTVTKFGHTVTRNTNDVYTTVN